MSKYTNEEIGLMNIDDIARKAKSIEEAQSMLKQYMWPIIQKMSRWIAWKAREDALG